MAFWIQSNSYQGTATPSNSDTNGLLETVKLSPLSSLYPITSFTSDVILSLVASEIDETSIPSSFVVNVSRTKTAA